MLHKTTNLLLLGLLVVGSIYATPILEDPEMALDEAVAGSIPVYSGSFTITSNASGGGLFPDGEPFRNMSGQTWLTLTVFTPLTYATHSFGCYGGKFFASCSVTEDPTTLNATFSFFQAGDFFFDVLLDGSGHPLYPTQPTPAEHHHAPATPLNKHFYPGIANEAYFYFNLNGGVNGIPIDDPDPDGTGGWLDDTGQPVSFQVAANIPEPGFGWLALTTLGIFGLVRRRIRR